jgi:2-oxoisovalerate dehydrogenase E1 component
MINEPFELQAFRRMALIRAFEAKALALSISTPPVVMGSVHLCAGQEAIPVGARAAINADDQVVATYRGHGWALESGISPRELLAEIAHRAEGINGGRAGSAMVMAPERGFAGENSIVGAGGPIAAGLALAFQRRGTGQIVAVSFGDGAMSQGGLHEAIVFATAEKLPVLFICENNGWAEMTRTNTIVPFENLSKRAHGYGIPGVTINGNDVVAVRDTVKIAADRARKGEGPCLIECKTARLWGHYNRDVEHYRDKQDRQKAVDTDPLVALEKRLIETSLATGAEIKTILKDIDAEIDQLGTEISDAPAPDAATAKHHVYAAPKPKPNKTSAVTTEDMTYAQAANAALRDALANDANVLIYGEDVGVAGGIFAVTRNLQKEFGRDRVFDTPIAEAAILGSAVGAAMLGMRPIVEIMWADFVLVALDTIINQAANVSYLTHGKTTAPIVVRMQQGVTPGSCAQHSQSLEAFFMHVPGLRVALPSTPQDAYDILRAAAQDPDPTIVIESRSFYQVKAPVTLGRPVESARGAALRREGNDVGIISWSTGIRAALEAAELLAAENIQASVLDLRWLNPIDDAAIAKLVANCNGRIIIVHEANETGGAGAEIAARISHTHFSALKVPVTRIATPDMRMPASPVLQAAVLPNAAKVVAAAKAMLTFK